MIFWDFHSITPLNAVFPAKKSVCQERLHLFVNQLGDLLATRGCEVAHVIEVILMLRGIIASRSISITLLAVATSLIRLLKALRMHIFKYLIADPV